MLLASSFYAYAQVSEIFQRNAASGQSYLFLSEQEQRRGCFVVCTAGMFYVVYYI